MPKWNPKQLGALVAWSVVAAFIGLGCFLLPDRFIQPKIAIHDYGHPLLPAIEHAFLGAILFWPLVLFPVGILLGLAQPDRCLFLGFALGFFPVVLHAINVGHDVVI